MKLLILNRYGRKGASSRLRSLQYLPWFAQAGIDYETHPLFSDELLTRRYELGRYPRPSVLAAYSARVRQLMRRHEFDLLWIEKEALPWMPASVERALLRGVPYVLDYDDAIFHQYDQHRSPWVRTALGRRIDALMRGARLVVCGNGYLADRARRAGAAQVVVVPTVIDLERYAVAERRTDDDGRPRIVWIGSPSTATYLAGLQAPLADLSRHHDFELRVIGVPDFTLPSVRVHATDWTEATEVDSLRACDIGIMPLADGPWERGKCGYKLVQYMACGLPVVGSPVGVNSDIIRAGENGFLARSDVDWTGALSALIESAELRRQFGAVGRRRVEEEYCVQRAAPKLISLLRQVTATR
ncbi:Spore coat protein SA [Burkholderiales bacterium]|nr:Spore coat protein SA [Burkholderiales bacterium]